MSFHNKHKIHNYFIPVVFHFKDVVGIKFFDKNKGKAACITWGRVYKEKELLELIKTQCIKYGFKNIEFIEYCYSLQEIAEYTYFYERWIYFVRQSIPYENGYKQWLQAKRQAILDGQDIKFVGF